MIYKASFLTASNANKKALVEICNRPMSLSQGSEFSSLHGVKLPLYNEESNETTQPAITIRSILVFSCSCQFMTMWNVICIYKNYYRPDELSNEQLKASFNYQMENDACFRNLVHVFLSIQVILMRVG